MNRTVLLSVLLTISPGLGADERVESLPSQYRKWLEEEVVYIITDREKEVFLSIETLEGRNRFIDAFWRKRDPNLVTPENEFKEEHYRRLQHANEFLGQETFRPGWKPTGAVFTSFSVSLGKTGGSTATTSWSPSSFGSIRVILHWGCRRFST